MYDYAKSKRQQMLREFGSGKYTLGEQIVDGIVFAAVIAFIVFAVSLVY